MSSFGFSVNKVPYKIEKTYELIFKESRVSSDQEISIPKIGDFSDLGFLFPGFGILQTWGFSDLGIFWIWGFSNLDISSRRIEGFYIEDLEFFRSGIVTPEIGNFSVLEIFFVSLDIPTKSFLC